MTDTQLDALIASMSAADRAKLRQRLAALAPNDPVVEEQREFAKNLFSGENS